MYRRFSVGSGLIADDKVTLHSRGENVWEDNCREAALFFPTDLVEKELSIGALLVESTLIAKRKVLSRL